MVSIILFSASWLKSELRKLEAHVCNYVLVEKLTGNNTRVEKTRVMELFKEG